MFVLSVLSLLACEAEKITVTQEDNIVSITDLDNDGYLSDVDCDDNDPSTYPDANEVCDGIDNNCDGSIDEGVLIEYFPDADGDGFGNGDLSIQACSQRAGFVPNGNDCDDTEATVHPGASELCDGLDNDCNEVVDDGNDVVVYQDADGDGYGNPDVFSSACTVGEGYVDNYLDCNDQNNTIHPNVDEYCDSIDNNCDGLIDNDALDAPTWYKDLDSDGYGNDEDTLNACLVPSGYVAEGSDCDDQDDTRHPFATELCDSIDQDCDGLTDEGTDNTFFQDLDGDGFGNFFVYVETCTPPQGYVNNAQDCNDTNIDVHPGALEYCNGYDDNCDTMVDENTAVDVATWYADVDGDGFGDLAVPVHACQAPPFYVATSGDCHDGRPNVFPGAVETCTTAYDDDCDGSNNDDGATGCLIYFEDADGDGYGISTSSQCLCVPEGDFQSLADSDCDDGLVTVNPGMIENCTTAYDDNCNTDTNEAGGAGCTYFYQDYDGDGFGTSDRVCMCEPVLDYEALEDGDCNDLNSLYSPSAIEVCDANDVDENCDGVADGADAVGATDWFFDGDADGYGTPNYMKTQCDQPTGYIDLGGDCADMLSQINPGMTETCFTLDDDDCSGTNNDPNALGCSTFFLDSDADGFGLASDTQCLCVAEASYSSVSSGDCNDNDEYVSPGRQETCDLSSAGVPEDEDCDGVVDEPNALDCVTYHYDFDGDNFGIGSDSICMCDTDGYYRAPIGGDCVDTDATINPGLSNCGLMGEIPRQDAGIVISGIEYSHSLYHTQTIVGNFDYNNDGFMDIAVVDPLFDTTYVDAGALFIFLGPLDSSVNISSGMAADLMFSPEIASEFLGRDSSISVGNWDGDAADEIIVSGQNNSYLIDDNLQGQVNISNNSTGVTVFSGVNTTEYAEGMHMVGDINQDGWNDVVRQDGYDVHLYFGDSTGGLTKTTQLFQHYPWYPRLSERFGSMDSNADSKLELVSPSRICNGIVSATQLCIHTYDDVTGQFTETSISNAGNYNGGQIVIGDFNGDGYEDLVSSDYRKDYYHTYRGTLTESGQLWVFYGTANGIVATSQVDADWVAYGDNYAANSGWNFGISLDVADVNNDGYDDLLVGSDRGGYLYYGPLQTYTEANGDPRDANSSDADASFLRLGRGVANVGDQNLDGYDDVVIGSYCSILNEQDVYDFAACGSDRMALYLFFGAEN